MELFNIPIPSPEAKTQDPCLPDPDLLCYYEFRRDRKFYLSTEIDDSVILLQQEILRINLEDAGTPKENRTPIIIYISSPGGNANMMWTLVDTILLSETPVYTVNIGNAYSAAALIFLAGEKRFMLPHASVMIHEGSTEIGGDSTKTLDAADSYRAFIKRMREFVLSRTSIPSSTLSRKHNNDWELTLDDALKYGVATHAVTSLSEIL